MYIGLQGQSLRQEVITHYNRIYSQRIRHDFSLYFQLFGRDLYPDKGNTSLIMNHSKSSIFRIYI